MRKRSSKGKAERSARHEEYKKRKRSPEYLSWSGMIQRCFNKKHRHYKDYGGRGITVCERWRKFANFLEDMGPRPEGLTLDRIRVNEGYGPGNCKWATPKEQQNNRRCSKSAGDPETAAMREAVGAAHGINI